MGEALIWYRRRGGVDPELLKPTTITNNGNYTAPITGTYRVYTIGGGGGGGGGCRNAWNVSQVFYGGAGTRGTLNVVNVTLNQGDNVVCTIGAGGTGGTNNTTRTSYSNGTYNSRGTNGTAGGSTSFGSYGLGAGGTSGKYSWSRTYWSNVNMGWNNTVTWKNVKTWNNQYINDSIDFINFNTSYSNDTRKGISGYRWFWENKTKVFNNEVIDAWYAQLANNGNRYYYTDVGNAKSNGLVWTNKYYTRPDPSNGYENTFRTGSWYGRNMKYVYYVNERFMANNTSSSGYYRWTANDGYWKHGFYWEPYTGYMNVWENVNTPVNSNVIKWNNTIQNTTTRCYTSIQTGTWWYLNNNTVTTSGTRIYSGDGGNSGRAGNAGYILVIPPQS